MLADEFEQAELDARTRAAQDGYRLGEPPNADELSVLPVGVA